MNNLILMIFLMKNAIYFNQFYGFEIICKYYTYLLNIFFYPLQKIFENLYIIKIKNILNLAFQDRRILFYYKIEF